MCQDSLDRADRLSFGVKISPMRAATSHKRVSFRFGLPLCAVALVPRCSRVKVEAAAASAAQQAEITMTNAKTVLPQKSRNLPLLSLAAVAPAYLPPTNDAPTVAGLRPASLSPRHVSCPASARACVPSHF